MQSNANGVRYRIRYEGEETEDKIICKNTDEEDENKINSPPDPSNKI